MVTSCISTGHETSLRCFFWRWLTYVEFGPRLAVFGAMRIRMPSSRATMSTTPIGRRLAISFAVVSLLAAAQCFAHVMLIRDVAREVAAMTRNETTIRAGLELATALREQYIHAAHSIAQGDRSHFDHYQEWTRTVEEAASRMSRVAADERPRIARITAASREFDRVFREEILPAAERGDSETVRRVHARVELVLGRAAHDADALAQRFERRMSHAHVSTTKTTHLGMLLAVGGILLIVLVASFSTIQIQRAVITPLARLTRAAEEVGKGNFRTGIGSVGKGEFRELGLAFDRMTEELHEREARLVQSERMAAIGQLAAGIAHEINNPIGVIRGYLRTMMPEANDASLREELRILDEEAAACQRIAEDLLAYARLPDLDKTDVEVDTLLQELVRRFASTTEGQHARVTVNAQPGKVTGDPIRLRQVVTNLIRNAVEADSRDVSVVGTQLSPTSYEIRVLDRGTGIPEGERERIFEPFFTRRRGGTGLGLAVCLGLVRAHGGRIEARAREGGGTELVVTLPSAAAAVSTGASSTP